MKIKILFKNLVNKIKKIVNKIINKVISKKSDKKINNSIKYKDAFPVTFIITATIVILIISFIILFINILASAKSSLNTIPEISEISEISFEVSDNSIEECSLDLPTTTNYTTTITEATTTSPTTCDTTTSFDIIETSSTRCEDGRQILAQLLYLEGNGTSWECQVALCSSFLNWYESIKENDPDYTLYEHCHNSNRYSPAYYIDSTTPTEIQYDVVDYVLSGNRVADVIYFRNKHYHSFGTPLFNIDNVYFSM